MYLNRQLTFNAYQHIFKFVLCSHKYCMYMDDYNITWQLCMHCCKHCSKQLLSLWSSIVTSYLLTMEFFLKINTETCPKKGKYLSPVNGWTPWSWCRQEVTSRATFEGSKRFVCMSPKHKFKWWDAIWCMNCSAVCKDIVSSPFGGDMHEAFVEVIN